MRHKPDLLSGTLRQNLDPFQQYDDAVLNSALESAGLFSLQNGAAEGKINLDTSIASGEAGVEEIGSFSDSVSGHGNGTAGAW